MTDAVFHISLDIDDAYSQANMNLRQGESGRLAAISLRQSGSAFDVDGCRAVCAGTRPDGSVFFVDCPIEKGLVLCTFSAVHTALPGTVKAEIRLYGSGDVLIASPSFSLEIKESAMEDGSIAQGDEATALTALISDAVEAIETMAATAITGAEVSVDNGQGEPSAAVELIPGEGGRTISFAFSNMKGEKGDKGERGEAGKDGADGRDGKDGAAGRDGASGKDGVSPVVSLSKSGAVTTLSVTDASGTRSAQIKDGAKGDKGETGAAGKDGRDGADGAPGKDGADGKNGNAIYAVRSSSTDVIVYFTHDVILNGNIPLQVGDLLLSQYNGNLWQISEITDSTVNAHYTGSTLKGPQGEAGAAGEDGLNGNSIFIVDASTASEIPGFAMSQIHNGERPVQVGDLLLQSGNGRLNQVTHVLEDANEVICKFTGSILSSGGGTEILNEYGIIKREHLPSGYPYAEPTVFLPETTPVFSEDMGVFVIMSGLDADMFIVGQSYTVNWNGTEYVSQATVQNDGSMKAIILGDMVGATQGVPTTGEPFVVMILDAAAQAENGIAAMVIPIDGSASVTLSITGETLTPVDAKFLPNATIFVDVYGTIGGTYEGYGEKTENISKQSHTNAEILALAKLGKNVIIRNYDSETGTAFKCYNLSEVDFNFARFTKVYFSSSDGIGSTIEVLINGKMSMQETKFA